MKTIHIYTFTILLSFSACDLAKKENKTNNYTDKSDTIQLECCSQNMPSRLSGINMPIQNVDTNTLSSIEGMELIPAGEFMMGSNDQWSKPDEYPRHKVKLNAYYMDVAPVTNAQFAEFIEATAYITTAEQIPDWEILKTQLPTGTQKPHDSILQPASLVFTPPNEPVPLNNHLVWWSWVKGANWKHPKGPESNLNGLDNHPVVHVSYFDALAYAKWVGKRLATEAEFEYAARGGLVDNIYPWGNERINKGEVKANSWQGDFPLVNTYKDGFYNTSPVKEYAANGYGLYDMAGNVWEWCNDWYQPSYYETLGEITKNPQGPNDSFDPNEPLVPKRVMRGGSYLCNDSYCSGFRVAARMKTDPYSSQGHVGFRCAKDI